MVFCMVFCIICYMTCFMIFYLFDTTADIHGIGSNQRNRLPYIRRLKASCQRYFGIQAI